MKAISRCFAAGSLVMGLGAAFLHCGSGGDSPSSSNLSSTPTDHPLSGFTLDCKGQRPQQQAQQVQFEQQKQDVCEPQFEFEQARLSDFFVNLDCDDQVVHVRNKGLDSHEVALPIQDDGSVKGEMRFKQTAKDDGRRHAACWVDFIVTFDGKAFCHERGEGRHLALNTGVSFQETSASEIPDHAGGAMARDELPWEATPSPSPSPTSPDAPFWPPTWPDTGPRPQNPQPDEPSETPSPNPWNILPLPGSSPSPQSGYGNPPSPRPTWTAPPDHDPDDHFPPTVPTVITPVISCVIARPCRVVAKTDMSCPAQQSGPSSSGPPPGYPSTGYGN